MGIWLEEATPLPAGDDGGSMIGGPSKLVWHTTEGYTARDAIGAMRERDSWAHLTVTYESGTFRAWQHIQLDRAARALQHPTGTVQTNRAGRFCVQVEVVAFAAHAPQLRREYLAGLAQLARAVEHQTGIPRRSTVQWLPYPDSYGANGVRLTPGAWLAYAGHLGHQHVPSNSHGDPGALNIGAILALPPPPPSSPRRPPDMLALIRQEDTAAVYAVVGGQLLHIGPGWLAAFAASRQISEDQARDLIVVLPAGAPLLALPRNG